MDVAGEKTYIAVCAIEPSADASQVNAPNGSGSDELN